MNKGILWGSISIFGFVGGWLPTLFGAGALSGWSLLGSTVGSFFGVWAAWKINQYYG